ncbi:MAG: hypothetical protein AB1489_08500 [Acidobacteriota bacterium]
MIEIDIQEQNDTDLSINLPNYLRLAEQLQLTYMPLPLSELDQDQDIAEIKELLANQNNLT